MKNCKDLKIAVVGTRYVSLSLAILLSQLMVQGIYVAAGHVKLRIDSGGKCELKSADFLGMRQEVFLQRRITGGLAVQSPRSYPTGRNIFLKVSPQT